MQNMTDMITLRLQHAAKISLISFSVFSLSLNPANTEEEPLFAISVTQSSFRSELVRDIYDLIWFKNYLLTDLAFQVRKWNFKHNKSK